MTKAPIQSGRVLRTLMRPFQLAAIFSALALLASLGLLAYVAWSSSQRLNSLERHIASLGGLQETRLGIQELLIRHINEKSPVSAEEIDNIRNRLQKIVEKSDYLYPDTPRALQEAQQLLSSDETSRESGLFAAIALVRKTLIEENKLQREAIAGTRESSETELVLAGITLFLAPLSLMLGLAYIRRISFRSLGLLSDLLENVGNLEFRTREQIGANDPLSDIFDRYNEMAERLKKASEAASRRQEDLEQKVHAAFETLLRQQCELADGARLAALGEFSARVAHELRNPISGITFALRNLQQELTDPDQKERIRLIGEEMDRVTRLLNSLLESTPGEPEAPRKVNLRSLVEDVVRLFRYQLPDSIDVQLKVEDRDYVLPRDTIRQVLLNLLKNSMEAIGTKPGVICVEMSCVDSLSKLVVADSGPGYPDDLLNRGIRPFRTGKTTGTGLGLSVIQRLVQTSGGEIKLGRGARGGAQTTVTLPCQE